MGRRSTGSKRKAERARHGQLVRRSTRDWLARGALALGLLVMGYIGTSSSLARVVAKIDPDRAHTMAPGNGVILADYAENAFSRAPTKDPSSWSALLARRALIADPTVTKALTVLGFQAQLRGDNVQADRIFSYSVGLSRREFRPRLWAIEDAVTRGDVDGALRNYDIALRTSNNARGILFPALSAALAEPRIRSGLIRILATHPVWEEQFIGFAANSGIEPEGTIALYKDGQKVGIEPGDDHRAVLVNVLVGQGKAERAWEYFRTFRSNARGDRSRDPEFKLQSNTRTAFDWRLGNTTGISAVILREGQAGLLDFSVSPSTSGMLISQEQILSPGIYRLDGRSRGIVQKDESRPYWTLTCKSGRDLGRVPLPNSKQNWIRFSGRFTVPQGCEAQTLALVARSTDDIMGINGQIERAQLLPVGNNR